MRYALTTLDTLLKRRRTATHRIAVKLKANIEGAAAMAQWRDTMMAKHRGLVICFEDLGHSPMDVEPGEIDLLLGVMWQCKAPA